MINAMLNNVSLLPNITLFSSMLIKIVGETFKDKNIYNTQITEKYKFTKPAREIVYPYFERNGYKSFNWQQDNIFYKDGYVVAAFFDDDTDINKFISNPNLSFRVFSDSYENAKTEAMRIDALLLPFLYSENRISWASLNPQGGIDYHGMALRPMDKIHNEFYPFINGGDIDSYIESFAESNNNVLILIGDPGMGKSTFINYMLRHQKWDSIIAYDPDVMRLDSFYLDFATGSSNAMVLEDSDVILGSRTNTVNKTMAKILNVSEGILSVNKKFIFTANLDNFDDVDPALTRPGRCFDVLKFRKLTRNEAEKAAAKINKVLPDHNDDEYTVAEIYNSKSNTDNNIIKKKFGFR